LSELDVSPAVFDELSVSSRWDGKMPEQNPDPRPSRRLLLKAGGLSAAAGFLGTHGIAIAGAPAPGGGADGTGAGADGAPPPPGSDLNRMAAAASAPTQPTSYNGWTVGTPGSIIGIANYTVPGTSVVLPIRSGDVSTILAYVARRFNAEVETLIKGQCWGYAYRANVNNPSVWSNHASGTAIDLNSLKHPNGAAATFTAAQISAVRRILAFCGKVVYWGQDYRGVVDGMHFEIDVPPGDPRISQLAWKIRSTNAPIGNIDDVSYRGGDTVRVTGWAFDPDQSTTEISIAIYVDGVGVSWFPTGVSRRDVNAAYGISGNHGFEVSLPMKPGTHSVTVFAINVPDGDNPVIGTRTVLVGRYPIGCVDDLSYRGNNTVRIAGWALDPDQPGTDIPIAVYVDGAGINWYPTGISRGDVNSAYGATGNHGFEVLLPMSPGLHSVTVRAKNVPGGDDPIISTGSVLVGANPMGYLDLAVPVSGGLRLRGWAFDPDNPNAEISVAVYIDGIGINWFPTGQARADVNRVLNIPGNHGFDFRVGASPGRRSVTVYAGNILGGNADTGIGAASVVV